ncbi:hypothetical protein BRARA_G01122 [Brassica rapa]|uniref:Uncharacterized protein n=1 Tax=Brassica campestris TaxID=3711 RepID=A0A397YSF3_BRACM|nr:hypothetical protein BRARA_G01122 [Brassica rapa]
MICVGIERIRRRDRRERRGKSPEEERDRRRKKREMGKKKCFVSIKPRVRRKLSVRISSVFSISIFAKYLAAGLSG